MDSEDSRSRGRAGSSSSDSSSESGSPRRRSPSSSPSSVGRKSANSDRRSEPNSPDQYWRSEESSKYKLSKPRSPSPESGDVSPSRRGSSRPHTPDAPRSPGSDTNQTSRSKWSTKSEMGSRRPSLSPPISPKSRESSPHSSPPRSRRSPLSPRSPRSPNNSSPHNRLIRSPDSSKIRSPGIVRHGSPRSPKDGSASPKATDCSSPRGSESPRGPRSPDARKTPPRNSMRRRSPHSPSPRKSRRSNSDSSRSSRGSSPRRPLNRDPPTEAISDGEMDFEHDRPINDHEEELADEKNSSLEKDVNNISHEDLSDVSDLESMGHASEDEKKTTPKSPIRAPDESSNNSDSPEPDKSRESRVNGNASGKLSSMSPPRTIISNGSASNTETIKIPQEKTSNTEDVEEQLDFEAEEGECVETPMTKQNNIDKNSDAGKEDGEEGGASSLEEGEVSDEEERRPEETEPRPVCRFYSRGQCTWGVSCRFLHPGVTDKGNYTMFDMVRAMPPGYGGPPLHHAPYASHMLHSSHSIPPSAAAAAAQLARESAWERGLRTAKEMMRKATKRKEQDSDFEEKKMHLSLAGSGRGGSLGPEEDDLELAAYAGYQPASPPPGGLISKREREREEYYRQAEREEYHRMVERRAVYEEIPRGYPKERVRYARMDGPPLEESPPPPHYEKGPGDYPHHKAMIPEEKPMSIQGPQKIRRGRTTREVIVQRANRVESGRGDEWADPWMRGGGKRGPPGPGEKRRRGKYTSASSYSSSSSSDSSSRSSSRSRRSASAARHRRPPNKSPPPRQRSGRAALSPSVIVQERRAATARAQAMNPPAPSSRKRPPSPAASRQHAANPPPPPKGVDAFGRMKQTKPRSRKRYSKSSSSGSDSSSSSSDSDSDSRSSSSSGSSGPAQTNTRPAAPSVIPPSTRHIRQDMKASITIQKKELDGKDALAKKRIATSPLGNPAPAKKPVSRREELLKQLKAVEDAIARKRSKV